MTPPAASSGSGVAIDVDLVRSLVAHQVPDLADEPVTFLATGWDNALFRVGRRHVARLPHRELAVPLLANEVRWLPELAPHLPLPVPAPWFVGQPGDRYPWPWTLVPWLDGEPLAPSTTIDAGATADALGRFVRALHRPAPASAPHNPFRSIPLDDRSDATIDRIRSIAPLLEHGTDAARLLTCWGELRRGDGAERPRTWIHGDLHPLNVLVDDGAPVAVIDFGDLSAGDPATDLAIAWMLFDDDAMRRRLHRAYGGVDDATDRRSRGWALTIAAAMLAGRGHDPAMSAIGRRTLAHVLTA